MAQFIYPYNFVSKDKDGFEQKLKKYKPLHRFDGISGRIKYKLKNISPLFIPDPEGTTIYKKVNGDDKDVHQVMDFFNVNGRLCLPPASIKGMVRNVFEAATNSTFGVFDTDDVKASFRKPPPLNTFVGIYRNGSIYPYNMAKLPLAALKKAVADIKGITVSAVSVQNIVDYQNEAIKILLWEIHNGAKVVVAFEMRGQYFTAVNVPTLGGVLTNGTLMARPDKPKKRQVTIAGNPKPYCCPGHFNPGKVQFMHYNFPEFGVIDPVIGNQRRPVDYNVINNRVVKFIREKQHWQAGQAPAGKATLWTSSDAKLLLQHFYEDAEVRESGNRMSSRYVYAIYPRNSSKPLVWARSFSDMERDYRDVNERGSRNRSFDRLRNEKPVFYRTGNDQWNGSVTEFGPVAMFKSAEKASLKEVVDTHSPHVLPPETSAELCPATRLYGWTPSLSGSSNEQGIAGRVRFSPAWGNKTIADTCLVPTKVLGGPKHKYYPFYLKPVDEAGGDQKAGYYSLVKAPPWSQTLGKIRGQKFYLTHPDACDADRNVALNYITCETVADISQVMANKISACIQSNQISASKVRVHASSNALIVKGIMTEGEKNTILNLCRDNGNDTNNVRQAKRKDREAIEKLFKESGISNQNTTCAVLPAGDAEFDGYIEFESLDPYELGGLLWCLRLSDDPLQSSPQHAHKLGKGKGIGMGSVQFKITDTDIELREPQNDWFSLNENEPVVLEKVDIQPFAENGYIQAFKTWITGLAQDAPDLDAAFEALPFIGDLKLVLKRDLAEDVPVAYHPDTYPPNKGFQYFMTQREKRKNNGEEALKTPVEIGAGQTQNG